MELSPRCVGTYTIFKRNGNEAYEFELLGELALVHLIFQVPMFKKFLGYTSFIVPIENVGIKDILSYEKIPVQILDRQVRKFV